MSGLWIDINDCKKTIDHWLQDIGSKLDNNKIAEKKRTDQCQDLSLTTDDSKKKTFVLHNRIPKKKVENTLFISFRFLKCIQ